jgi:ankyrin repeat protein
MPQFSNVSLIDAIYEKDLERIDKLLAKPVNPNVTDELGFTALMISALAGNLTIVKKLVDAGANVNTQSHDASKMTAIFAAVSTGHADIAAYLIFKGAKVNNNLLVPLAASQGQTEVVRVLIAAGAPFDIKVDWEADFMTVSKMTAQQIAEEAGYDDIVEILKEATRNKPEPSILKKIFSAIMLPGHKSVKKPPKPKAP